MIVKIYNKDDTSKKLDYAVIVTKYKNQLVLVKHKDRNTYEIPGGHIDAGETALEAAKRELKEETGAIDFNIENVAIYGVNKDGFEDYGGLFYAECYNFEALHHEIESIKFFDKLPDNLTYPQIQPHLFKAVETYLQNK